MYVLVQAEADLDVPLKIKRSFIGRWGHMWVELLWGHMGGVTVGSCVGEGRSYIGTWVALMGCALHSCLVFTSLEQVPNTRVSNCSVD